MSRSSPNRSHPPSLCRLVERSLKDSSVPRGARIAVAVSGGPDSMALLHALTLLREKRELELLAISVDHGLRAESAGELEFVREFCRAQRVEFEGVSLGLVLSSNIQAEARRARYSALWEVTRARLGEDAFLATAHHQRDRAETVLLRLLRGTSVEGLGVLRAREGFLLRPLGKASREAVDSHLLRHELASLQDPSNQNPRFLRVRVRQELLPLLRELAPGIEEQLCALAEEAGEEEPLGLNREQRSQLRHALRNPGSRVDLRLPGRLRLWREDP